MGILFWVIGIALASGTAFAQISPGPLSRSHQDLEGATKCVSCHAFGLGQRALKCLDCHTEIARRVSARTGYHSIIYKASQTQLDCARCHNEHAGRRFQLVKFDTKNFDHARQTGFELQGKHASLSCEKCHNAEHVIVQSAEIRVKDKNHTFLGLGRECAQCHQDPHKGEFNAECTSCHSQTAWKPADKFEHNKTRYPLTGKHISVSCSGCHKPSAGASLPRFDDARFTGCDDCHSDPHKGAFNNTSFIGACSTCHAITGWKSVSTNVGFDHGQTKFPLRGKHAEVTCFKCHTNADFSKPVAHATCADCHKDIHQGQFANRAGGSDCSSCHSEQQFKPALYTLEMHQQSAFRLEGKHETVTCESCHKPAGAETLYKLKTTTCQGCHSDPHGAEFTAQPYANQCESCHTLGGFHPSTFTLAKHQQTQFALTGAHQAVICADCHKPLPAASSAAERQYHFNSQACTACHQDPHRTRETCETCHNTAQWKTLRTFNHNTTKFALEGAHQTVGCVNCHRAPNADARVKASADFANTPTLCHDCHEDIHGGQFMRPGEQAQECTACHEVATWTSRIFDHARTRFALEGAHEKVRCAQCHTQTLKLEQREVRNYRDTPLDCKSCHSDLKQTPQ